jgi:hypothetical protein
VRFETVEPSAAMVSSLRFAQTANESDRLFVVRYTAIYICIDIV